MKNIILFSLSILTSVISFSQTKAIYFEHVGYCKDREGLLPSTIICDSNNFFTPENLYLKNHSGAIYTIEQKNFDSLDSIIKQAIEIFPFIKDTSIQVSHMLSWFGMFPVGTFTIVSYNHDDTINYNLGIMGAENMYTFLNYLKESSKKHTNPEFDLFINHQIFVIEECISALKER